MVRQQARNVPYKIPIMGSHLISPALRNFL
jgi:hypothetical protein